MKLKEIQYRMRIRKALNDAPQEELKILKEELKREQERRTKCQH